MAGATAGIGRGNDAGGRPGHHRLCGFTGNETRRDHAAIAIHDQEIALVTLAREFVAQPGDVTLEDRLDGGIHGGGHATLEFARLRQKRVADSDVIVRPEFGRDLRGAAFMKRIGIGMQEMNDEGFTTRRQQPAYGMPHAVFVERNAHLARRFHAFVDLKAQETRNDGLERAGHAIGLRPGTPAEFDDIAEPGGGDHAGPRQTALQHGIGGGGGAMNDQVDVGWTATSGAERGDDAEGLIVEGGRRLRNADPAAIATVDQDKVGEGAANVDAGDDIVGLRRNFLIHCRNPKSPNCR